MRESRSLIAMLVLSILNGCAQTGTLYPLDRKAEEEGQLQISPCTSDGAEMRIPTANGEILAGSCKITADFSPWFPRFSSLGGTGGYSAPSEAGVSSPGEIPIGMVPPRVLDPRFAEYPVPGAQGFEAILSGGNSTSAHCWYFVSVFTQTGAGSCQFSSGAHYLMVF
jgi:hypothetical protein